jgi:hypothetical protein
MYSLLIKAALIGGALSAPVFPLSDGFPTPNPGQIKSIEQTALGTLSNNPPPPKGAIPPDAITSLQLINLNENFEVAFFNSLLYNVTNSVSGFQISDQTERNFVLETLKTVIAVSQLAVKSAPLTCHSKKSFTRSMPLALSRARD